MRKKLDKLEAIRGFAAVYVVLHHTYYQLIDRSWWTFIFEFGQEAVILFFILSGFVIQYSFSLSKDQSFKTYFFKRFNRIYIPLLLVFIANYLILYLQGDSTTIDGKNLAGNLFMLQDIPYKPNVFCRPFLGNDPLWSLSYEWWFYMIYFFVFYYFRKNISNVIYILGIIGAISYIFYPFWGNRIFMYMIIWNVGADLAKIYLANGSIKFNDLYKQFSVLFVCVLLLALNFYLNKDSVHALLHREGTTGFGMGISPALEFRHFFFTIVALGIGILWYRLKWPMFNFSIGLFEKFAPISYCFYISHWFLISRATYLSFINNVFLRYALYFVICIVFSYLVERIIYVKINGYIVKLLKKNTIAQ